MGRTWPYLRLLVLAVCLLVRGGRTHPSPEPSYSQENCGRYYPTPPDRFPELDENGDYIDEPEEKQPSSTRSLGTSPPSGEQESDGTPSTTEDSKVRNARSLDEKEAKKDDQMKNEVTKEFIPQGILSKKVDSGGSMFEERSGRLIGVKKENHDYVEAPKSKKTIKGVPPDIRAAAPAPANPEKL